MVKIDRLPRSRLITPGGGKVRIGGVVGWGGIYYPQSDLNPVDLQSIAYEAVSLGGGAHRTGHMDPLAIASSGGWTASGRIGGGSENVLRSRSARDAFYSRRSSRAEARNSTFPPAQIVGHLDVEAIRQTRALPKLLLGGPRSDSRAGQAVESTLAGARATDRPIGKHSFAAVAYAAAVEM